jgi:hypothetical protein
MLFGFAIILPCFAEENHSTAPGAATERGTTPPRSADDGSAGTGKDAGSPAAKGDEANGVDTRVTVLPRHPRDKMSDVKAVTTATPRNLLERRPRAPAAVETVHRNAIGMTVIRHEGPNQHLGAHNDVQGVTRPPVPDAGHFANTERLGDRTTSNASTIAKSIAPNRGMINGTRQARPGSSLSAIGGPAGTVAGISGTTIRPKH